jgi:CheY-like chemotaxis protein
MSRFAHGSQSKLVAQPANTPIVLVIDDDDVSRQLLQDALRDSCSQVKELSSPIGVTRMLEQEQIDVVVLDVEMPNLRGDKLVKLFRQSPRVSYVGVVLVSGCAEAELRALGAQCDADGVVTKSSIGPDLVPVVWTAWRNSLARRARHKAEAVLAETDAAPESLARPYRKG